MVLRNETIDDRQNDTIRYQGIWFTTGTYQATSTSDSGTLSSSNIFDANFTVDTPPILVFYYFGIKRSQGGFYQICIDCDPNNRVWEDIDGLNATDDGHNPPVVLYSKQFDDAGPHEIIVTNRKDTRFANGNSQITLDKLVYTIDDGTVSNSTVTTTATIPNTPTGSQTTSATPSGDGNGSKSNVSVAAIVGGVVGGILLILVCVFFLLRRRRRMRGQGVGDGDGDGDGDGELSSSSDPNTIVGVPSSYSSQNVTGSDVVSAKESGSQMMDPINVDGSRGGTTGTGGGRIAVRREEDGGSIHGFGLSEFDGEDGRTLPPDYYDIPRHNGQGSEI